MQSNNIVISIIISINIFTRLTLFTPPNNLKKYFVLTVIKLESDVKI